MRKFINQNSSSPSYKNIKLTELYQRFKDSARGKDSETCEKRKYFNLSDSEPSVKSRKFNEKTKNSVIEGEERETVWREATDSTRGNSGSQGTSEIPGIYDRFAIIFILMIVNPFQPSELPWSKSFSILSRIRFR